MTPPKPGNPQRHDDGTPVVLAADQRRARRGRSIAIAVILGCLALLFYLVTIVKFGPAVLNRPL